MHNDYSDAAIVWKKVNKSVNKATIQNDIQENSKPNTVDDMH